MRKKVLLFLLSCLTVFPLFASDKISVQVRFTEDVKTEKGIISFTDALYYPLDKYQEMKEEDIQKDKQSRMDNFKKVIETPVVEVEITKEQLEEQKRQMEESKASLEAQIAEIDSKIKTK